MSKKTKGPKQESQNRLCRYLYHLVYKMLEDTKGINSAEIDGDYWANDTLGD